MSSTLTDADGVVRFRGTIAGGGSQPVKVISFPFAFDTPGILAGLTVYTPAVGECFLGESVIRVLTAWNGTTPQAFISSQGEDAVQAYMVADLTTPDAGHDAGGHVKNAAASSGATGDYFADTTPLVLTVDDGAAGDPASTTGTAEVVLLVGVPS